MSSSSPPPSTTAFSNAALTSMTEPILNSKEQPQPHQAQQPNHGTDGTIATTSTSPRRTSTDVVNMTSIDSSTSNPWRDESSSTASASTAEGAHKALKTPDPALLDASIVSPLNSLTLSTSSPPHTNGIRPTHAKRGSIIGSGVGIGFSSPPSSPTRASGFPPGIGVELSKRPPTPPLKSPPLKEVLNAFDPLADDQEKAARNAWEMSQGNPPDLPPKDSSSDDISITVESGSGSTNDSQPPPPPRTGSGPPQNASLPSSGSFPSFAALARSFALPLGGRHTRPLSMDAAKPVPSPASLSSFVAQQQQFMQSGQDQQSPLRQSPILESNLNQPPDQQQPQQPQEEEASGSGFGFGLGFIGLGGGNSRPASRMDGKARTPTASPGAANASLPNAGTSPNGSAGSGARSVRTTTPTSPTRRGTQTKPSSDAFDFQTFLDQLKSRSAEPVAKYLRSFLSNFAKRTFTMNDQVKIIGDFLNFISNQMRNCDVWKATTDPEFDNAMEGMEKLVMNRLYEFTFTPEIARAEPRRPITTDDLERDRVLAQRIALFGWLEEKHLDVPEEEGSRGFMMFAQQELIKINHYKAPRDKLICILNCCKVIFGLIRHLKKEEGADSFLPILIFVVLKANPDHLLSNVEFISRFRNPMRLQSEAGYYLSSLMGAVSFIENMDHTSLSNMTQEEFEKNVEGAIQSLPDGSPVIPSAIPTTYLPYKTLPRSGTSISLTSSAAIPYATPPRNASPSLTPRPTPIGRIHAGEESATPLSLAAPNPAVTLGEDAKRLLLKTGDTISKPLSAIGRIFTEALDGAENRLISSFEKAQTGNDDYGSSSSGQQGFAYSQQQQQWSHPEQVRSYATYHSNSSGGSLRGVPQTPGDGSYTPPIQTPYKPRVRRAASPSVYVAQSQQGGYASSYPGGSPGLAGYPYAQEDSPTRTTGGAPYTHQSLAMGPSQPYYQYNGGGNGGNGPIAAPQFVSPAPTRGDHGLSPTNANFLSPLPPRVHSLINSEGSYSQLSSDISRTPTPNLDIAAIQAQIDSVHEQEQAETESKRETLRQIFPGVDMEIVELVLEGNGGDLGRSIEALLDMSSGS